MIEWLINCIKIEFLGADMGISIGQYRVRIGTHNCIWMKNYQTCFQGSFLRVMLMLFQLINIIMVIMLMFVYICFLRIFCVSPEHPNFESFHCYSGTRIPILVVTCMYYIIKHILCVTTTFKISKPLCLCRTNSASHCATVTNRTGKPLCHCHTWISKPLCHCYI